MAWKRNKPSIAKMPAEPSLILWLFAGLVALIAGVLVFVLHANHLLQMWQQYNVWLLSGAPVFVWFVLICLRGWIYNNGVDKHEFEAKEANYAQQQWVEWAGRYQAVLHSTVILAGAVTPQALLQQSTGLTQHNKQSRRIEDSCDHPFDLLLRGVRNRLQQLSPDLPLKIILLTDSPDDDDALQKAFSDCWQQQMPEGSVVPSVEILRSYSFAAIEHRIKTPEILAELILVHQMHGKEHYSDALAALLLTLDDVADRFKLEHDVRLLRPMPLDTDDLLTELDLYFCTQTQANTTGCIIGDHLRWGDDFATLLEASEKYGGNWKTEQLHWLETYAGICGPFSSWIVAAVVSDLVRLQRADCLMLSGSADQRFINTVATGNKDQKHE
ncbi:hypothetical protein [Enterobacter asburiae]|uniref:hypothetical protein n=1 Tax=Enterobacter asburiae TaxID=61645 RepID=UPI0021D140B2|nr:hypothetical protein [Enterobacter asburiae]MCU6239912.1 hypothetical protein [Enterobacter asburiae]